MGGALNSVRILIVEDHEFQRVMLERALRVAGVELIEIACNGAEALHLLRSSTTAFDLVITDIVMPEVDGIELIGMFAEIAPGVPLVLCSSHQWALEVGMHIAEAKNVPMLGALRKPLTPATLASVFDKLFTHLRGEGLC